MDFNAAVANLTKNGFNVVVAENKADALQAALMLIPTDASVGFGGSATIKELGLPDALRERGNETLYRPFFPESEHAAIMKKSVFADWFVSGTNAITEEGELVNIDGNANRVASQLFGGKYTLIIAGENKIVKDLAEGIIRARTTAARLNCVRFGKNNPCVYGGDCRNCKTENTICNVTTVLHHPTRAKTFYVVLVREFLGY
jgi:Uncharacterised ACR, YkgG family COG1556.